MVVEGQNVARSVGTAKAKRAAQTNQVRVEYERNITILHDIQISCSSSSSILPYHYHLHHP